MQIIDCEQRSPEWWELRKKRMTASHAQAIGNIGKGLESYVLQLMQEYYSYGDPNRYSGIHTERGRELEDSAVFVYESTTEKQVTPVGFVIHNEHVGCSPDGLCGEDGMVEIKCPDDKEYFRLLLGGDIKPEYVWQIQMQLLVCERSWCDFVAFNPNYDKEIIITRVLPDHNKFAKLEAGFEAGVKMIREIEAKANTILKGAA
jgi:putative phage-type endonuclease